MIALHADLAFEAEAALGEGPVWWRDELLWVDILGGRVLASAEQGTRCLVAFDSPVSGVFPREGGGLVLLQDTDVVLLDADLREERRIPVLAGQTGSRLSDGAVGPRGEIWFGSMRHDLAPGGSLFRLGAGDSAAEEVVSGLGMPNGMAFSALGDELLFVDSSARTVNALPYAPGAHRSAEPRVLLRIDEALGTPDGLAVDAEGGIWIALWGGGRLLRLSADGDWTHEVRVPATQTTSCAFGGPEAKTLLITTATVELSERERRLQPGAGSVFSVPCPFTGLEQKEARL